MPSVTVQALTDLIESDPPPRFLKIDDTMGFLNGIEAFVNRVVSGTLYHCKLVPVGKTKLMSVKGFVRSCELAGLLRLYIIASKRLTTCCQ